MTSVGSGVSRVSPVASGHASAYEEYLRVSQSPESVLEKGSKDLRQSVRRDLKKPFVFFCQYIKHFCDKALRQQYIKHFCDLFVIFCLFSYICGRLVELSLKSQSDSTGHNRQIIAVKHNSHGSDFRGSSRSQT